jgi:trk system potassium uptake protein
MIKQFAIIGIHRFAQRMLEELSQVECEILIIDRDPEVIEKYKERARNAYIANVLNEDTIKKLIPQTIDAAIIDLGSRIEASILVTNYLKKLGISEIIAKAETDEHAEILNVVGATQIIFPNREAARRIVPALVTSTLFNYMPISNGLVIAEVKVPKKFIGMNLIDADLRRRFGLNVIAIREGEDEYKFFEPEFKLSEDYILLVAGSEEHISSFSGKKYITKKKSVIEFVKHIFGRGK